MLCLVTEVTHLVWLDSNEDVEMEELHELVVWAGDPLEGSVDGSGGP